MSATVAQDWERLWAPYDEPTYQAALSHVRPDDVVLEIGAGDLRLARRLAQQARRVYALEIQPHLLQGAWGALPDRLANLRVICGDARQLPFPADVTLGVLLMRHCRHFRLYADKLLAAGCRRLVTNARWRFGLEHIDLSAPHVTFRDVILGWYACRCGATGFVPCPPERLTPTLEAIVQQVSDCPNCRRGT